MADLFATHKPVLDQALAAIAGRGYWAAYPEMPSGKIYGETAKADAEAAFQALLNKPFALDQPGSGGFGGRERSPYGLELGITYPKASVPRLLEAARKAAPGWAEATPEARVGVCLEILHRLNRQSFLIAQAVMHTSGQAFVMAFQAGGPHAQDRGLEAVAYAYDEMKRVPVRARWEKPAGKGEPLRLDKEFRIVPRGIAVVIGCSTFPTWNSYPGLFASLATGNPVIVKPHPGAILPLALTVKIGREVLKEAGFDPNVLLLAADLADGETQALVTDPLVAIIDFTGGPAFGRWLEENARQAQLFTEKAGINPVVIDSTDDFEGMCANIAFSLSLYSGQMCTAPQNIFVPRSGIATDQGHKTFEEVGAGIARAIDRLLGDPDRAAAVLGAIQSDATWERVQKEAAAGEVVHPATPVAIPGFPQARAVTPLVRKVAAAAEETYAEEKFGPISFLIATGDTAESIRRAAAGASAKGAITAAIYTTDPDVLVAAEKAFAEAGVALSENLTGGVFVNQSAAFSDYHVSGANPAGNACLTDAAFVANRFRVAMVRRPAKAA
ncbi:phenylacetic acid degradation protein PaaN [Benzoatithermus flavus]|uniref:Phenylacetic acid degradation protein PaaN n=1 Tax=Benzoatithermus flavus TaxID=3108223 RepID=A0ABU8XUZ3_9PROT